MNDTRERILQAALRLFSVHGYGAVSVSDIAGEVGITKGALYRHYQNKRDVFDSILRRMEQRDAEQARAYAVPEGTKAEMENAYREASFDAILTFSKAMFRVWTQDEFAAQFRRMLTLEQFRNEEMGRLYQQYLGEGPLDYVTDLFDSMGVEQPRQKAVEFYAPMYLLYSVYDAAADKAAVLALADGCLESLIQHREGESINGYHHSP